VDQNSSPRSFVKNNIFSVSLFPFQIQDIPQSMLNFPTTFGLEIIGLARPIDNDEPKITWDYIS
jgi:hypothetical protein